MYITTNSIEGVTVKSYSFFYLYIQARYDPINLSSTMPLAIIV